MHRVFGSGGKKLNKFTKFTTTGRTSSRIRKHWWTNSRTVKRFLYVFIITKKTPIDLDRIRHRYDRDRTLHYVLLRSGRTGNSSEIVEIGGGYANKRDDGNFTNFRNGERKNENNTFRHENEKHENSKIRYRLTCWMCSTQPKTMNFGSSDAHTTTTECK